jgi:glyoxylase-like metal-dependent hydrolase (beta-lactamase superfamily II)
MAQIKDFDPLSEIGDGIVQIRLPMAGNPLRYINGYLIEEPDGYTLIDCGWKADDVLEALRSALALRGLVLTDIRRLLITHFHFDHYGLAGTLLREGVRELWMHRLDWMFAQMMLQAGTAADAEADDWIARNGLRVDEMLEDELHHRRTELARPTSEAEDGTPIGRLRAIWTPGHSPGHLCFLDTQSRRIFTGDHVLDPITPHVGIWNDDRGDALGEYVASLRKVAAFGANAALPAHGEPFPDLIRRVDELLAHEEEREARVLAALDDGHRDATSIARALPWTRSQRRLETLSAAHQQFAVAETLAHLQHLVQRGVVRRDAAVLPYAYERV